MTRPTVSCQFPRVFPTLSWSFPGFPVEPCHPNKRKHPERSPLLAYAFGVSWGEHGAGGFLGRKHRHFLDVA